MAEQVSVDFSNASVREEYAERAGNQFQEALETMAETLSNSNDTSLGEMVKTQLKITEQETAYSVQKGLPEKTTKAVSQVGQKIAQTAG